MVLANQRTKEDRFCRRIRWSNNSFRV